MVVRNDKLLINNRTRLWGINGSERTYLPSYSLFRYMNSLGIHRLIIHTYDSHKPLENLPYINFEVHYGIVGNPSKYDENHVYMRFNNCKLNRYWSNQIIAASSLDKDMIRFYYEYKCEGIYKNLEVGRIVEEERMKFVEEKQKEESERVSKWKFLDYIWSK